MIQVLQSFFSCFGCVQGRWVEKQNCSIWISVWWLLKMLSMSGHVFVNTDYSLDVTSGFQGAPTVGRITGVHTSVPSDKSIVGHYFAVYSTLNKLKNPKCSRSPLIEKTCLNGLLSGNKLLNKRNTLAMGKFSALPRGSIKSLFYSVNPFPVETRAYRRGSHAAWEAAAEMKHSRQKGLTALGSLPGQRLRGGGAVGIPATMPDQADFPLGCRHNTFLTQGDTRNVEQAPRHTGCAREGAKGNTRFFFSSRRRREKKGFCKRAITDRKEPRHKVLLLFFNIRMPHSKFPKAAASLCCNPVAAFWDDLHWLPENSWRVFERGIYFPCFFCANCRSALAHRRAL